MLAIKQKPADRGGFCFVYYITASSRSPIGKSCYSDDDVQLKSFYYLLCGKCRRLNSFCKNSRQLNSCDSFYYFTAGYFYFIFANYQRWCNSQGIIVKQKPVNENTIQQTFMIHGEIKIFRFKFYC